MNGLLLSAPEATQRDAGTSELTEPQSLLKQIALDSVTSPNTRRSYAKLDPLFAFSAGWPLTHALLQESKATMHALAPSTINVRTPQCEVKWGATAK
jgi:hypothetical protein